MWGSTEDSKVVSHSSPSQLQSSPKQHFRTSASQHLCRLASCASLGRLRGQALPRVQTPRAGCVCAVHRGRRHSAPGCRCMGHTVPSLAPPHFRLKVRQEHAAIWALTLNVHNINFNLKQQCYTVQLLVPTYFVSEIYKLKVNFLSNEK